MWDVRINEILKSERGISFEEIADIISAEKYLAVIKNPNYSNQKIFVVALKGYVFAVPFVIDGEDIFLKTIYPSRKLRMKYME